MSSMFIHTLTHIRTPRSEGSLDEYGQPTAGTPVEVEVQGIVQPQTAREPLDSRSAGAEIADHVIFLPLMDVHPTDAFEKDGVRYEIQGIRRFDFGGLAHLEIDTRRVTGAAVGSVGS